MSLKTKFATVGATALGVVVPAGLLGVVHPHAAPATFLKNAGPKPAVRTNGDVGSFNKGAANRLLSVPQADNDAFDNITVSQVHDAIIRQYPEKFGASVRANHRASEFNAANVSGFTATINGLTNVGVTFSRLKVLNPEGKGVTSDTLVFQTTIHHANYQPKQLGNVEISGFSPDTVLTNANRDALASLAGQTLTVAGKVTVVASVLPLPLASATTLNLPAGINTIESGSFRLFNRLSVVNNLQNVRLVESYAFFSSPLTKVSRFLKAEAIGDYAFKSARLKGLTLPDSLVKVGDGAFLESPLTGTLNLPSALTSVGNTAFESALVSKLSVSKNAHLRLLGDQAFAHAQVTSLTLPDSLLVVGNEAFQKAPVNTLSLDRNLVSVGDGAFLNAKAKNLTIPSSLVAVGNEAFGLDNLTSLVVLNTAGSPSHLATIGKGAFGSATLSEFTVPHSVTFIGSNAFRTAPITTLFFGGAYRSNIVLAPGSFGSTHPKNVFPGEWKKIARDYPNAFLAYPGATGRLGGC